jgi:hypothetical protein
MKAAKKIELKGIKVTYGETPGTPRGQFQPSPITKEQWDAAHKRMQKDFPPLPCKAISLDG